MGRRSRVVVYSTVVALLAAPAAVAAHDELADVELQQAARHATPSVIPAGPTATQQTFESPNLTVTFYSTRAGFDSAHPGLPIEDFEDFTDALIPCDAPANNGTSCPGGYEVGEILPGLEIDCALFSGPGNEGLVIIPTGFDFNTSIIFGSNHFSDNTIINLDPAVAAIGFDASCHLGSPQMDIAVYDGNGALIWGGNHTPCQPTGFFLGWSTTDPAGIGRVELNDPSDGSVESIDNVAFGRTGCEIDSDFNGTADGWFAHSGAWYVNSEYLYTYGEEGTWSSASYVEDFADFWYEARMWRGGCDNCSTSLVFRGTPDPLTPENNWFNEYNLAYARVGFYSLWKREGGGPAVAVVPWNFSSAINQGDGWNTLRVEASGTSLSFYINGALLWSGTDSSLSSGRVGLAMFREPSGTGDELRVDWAYLCTLSLFADGFESGNTSAWSTTVP